MSRKKLVTIITVCIVVVIVALTISLPVVGPESDPVVDFTDSKLETIIRVHLNDETSEPIHVSELAELTGLLARLSGIKDISVLQYCTSLTYLYLGYNQINDISPLANLTNLTELRLYSNQISDISSLANLTNLGYLYLMGNQISDISPLLKNEGLGDGDIVDLWGNPLSDDSINIYIPELEERGVKVSY